MTEAGPSFEDLVPYASGEAPRENGEPPPDWLDSPGVAATVARLRRIIRLLRADDLKPVPDEVRRLAWEAFGGPPVSISAARWIEGAVRLIARLISDSRSEAALAGYRGSDTAVRLAYDSAAGPIDLRAIALQGSPDELHRIKGRVAPAGAGPLEVAATRPGATEAVAVTGIESGGGFSLDLAPGVYDLVFRLVDDGRVVVLPDLEVGRREA